ncbi:hypothetical protein BDV10DRAFT_20396 [Aspergillus recurvatus]
MGLNMIGRSVRALKLQRAEYNVVSTRSTPHDSREYPVSGRCMQVFITPLRSTGLDSVRLEWKNHIRNMSLDSAKQTIVAGRTEEVLRAGFSMPRSWSHGIIHNWRITLDAGSRFTAELAKNHNDNRQYQKLLRFVERSLVAIVVQASLLFSYYWSKRVG